MRRLTSDMRTIKRVLAESLNVLNNPTTQKVYKNLNRELQKWTPLQWGTILGYFRKNPPQRLNLPRGYITPIQEKISHNQFDYLIIMPLGGAKDYRKNLRRLLTVMSHTVSRGCLAVVIDNQDPDRRILQEVEKILLKTNLPYNLYCTKKRIGYIPAVNEVITAIKKSHFKYIGFVDDDAYLLNNHHYNILISILENQNRISAVSGLAVDNDSSSVIHNFFNLTNKYSFFKKVKSLQYNLSKPHIHGGGGGCLLKSNFFMASLKKSIQYKTLLGPTISAVSKARKYDCRAIQECPVLHPTKSSFFSWLCTVRKYYHSWNALETRFPRIRKSWERYLSQEKKIYKKIQGKAAFTKYLLLKEFRAHFKFLFLN